jgi:hypothetical protein
MIGNCTTVMGVRIWYLLDDRVRISGLVVVRNMQVNQLPEEQAF